MLNGGDDDGGGGGDDGGGGGDECAESRHAPQMLPYLGQDLVPRRSDMTYQLLKKSREPNFIPTKNIEKKRLGMKFKDQLKVAALRIQAELENGCGQVLLISLAKR